MVFGIIAGIAGAALGFAGRSSQAAAARDNAARQEAYMREREEYEKREKTRIAALNHRQQILALQQNYNDQLRNREWRYQEATTAWAVKERQAVAQQKQQEFGWLVSEVNRRAEWQEQYFRNQFNELSRSEQAAQRSFENQLTGNQERRQYENSLTSFLLGQKQEERQVETRNWQAQMAYEQAENARQLKEAEEKNRVQLERLRNRMVEQIADSRFSIAIGNINADVVRTQIQASGVKRAADKKKMQEQGAMAAMGQSGNTLVRLMGDAERRALAAKQEATAQLSASVGAAELAQAQAKLQRAAAMLDKRFTAEKRWAKGVTPYQEQFLAGVAPTKYIERPDTPGYRAGPALSDFRAGVAPPKRIATVAPIRGPKPQEPDYPNAPVIGQSPSGYVPKPPSSNPFMDLLGSVNTGLQFYDTYQDLKDIFS